MAEDLNSEYPFAELYGEKTKGFVNLSSNENPFGPSEKVKTALKKYLKYSSIYPDPFCTELTSEISKMLNLAKDNIFVGNGSDEVIEVFLKFVMEKNKFRQFNVVTANNSFKLYKLSAQTIGAKVTEIPLVNHSYNIEKIIEFIHTHKQCVITIANPLNPTGTIVEFDKLKNLAEHILQTKDCYLLIDEAYYDYADYLVRKNIRPRVYDTFLKIMKSNRVLQKKTIVTRTFSKAYGLAGLRVGYGVSDEEVIAEMKRIKMPFNVNGAAQFAALSAIKDKKYIEKTLKNNADAMKIVEKYLIEKNIKFVQSWANFVYIYFESPKAGVVCKQLMKKKFLVRDMSSYNDPFAIRVTMGKKKDMKNFIEALNEVLSV